MLSACFGVCLCVDKWVRLLLPFPPPLPRPTPFALALILQKALKHLSAITNSYTEFSGLSVPDVVFVFMRAYVYVYLSTRTNSPHIICRLSCTTQNTLYTFALARNVKNAAIPCSSRTHTMGTHSHTRYFSFTHYACASMFACM